jgi:hypothetical protein
MGALSLPIAVVISGLLVWGASTAAFSGTTTNDGSTWTAGSISLKNDRATALFNSTKITPGFTETHCITISSTSDVPSTLKMYTSDVSSTGVPVTLAEHLLVQVTEGSGAADASCTGFFAAGPSSFDGTLSAFSAVNNYANGVGAYQIAPGATNQYKVTVSLPDGAPNSLQSTTATAKFVWEAQG